MDKFGSFCHSNILQPLKANLTLIGVSLIWWPLSLALLQSCQHFAAEGLEHCNLHRACIMWTGDTSWRISLWFKCKRQKSIQIFNNVFILIWFNHNWGENQQMVLIICEMNGFHTLVLWLRFCDNATTTRWR